VVVLVGLGVHESTHVVEAHCAYSRLVQIGQLGVADVASNGGDAPYSSHS
jgi:hypothetical protein